MFKFKNMKIYSQKLFVIIYGAPVRCAVCDATVVTLDSSDRPQFKSKLTIQKTFTRQWI